MRLSPVEPVQQQPGRVPKPEKTEIGLKELTYWKQSLLAGFPRPFFAGFILALAGVSYVTNIDSAENLAANNLINTLAMHEATYDMKFEISGIGPFKRLTNAEKITHLLVIEREQLSKAG